MSVDAVTARIAQIQALTAAPAAPRPSSRPGASSFASALQSVAPAVGTAPLAPPSSTMLAAAQQEVGVAEQPPGSNDGPRIAEYRTATAGAGIGPWCAYFVSWLGRQAGTPLGEAGQGFGAVKDVAAWAQRTGRSLPAGATPQPGDLIVWGSEHIGIVESVDPDGRIHTIEGNSSNAVSRRTYGADGGGATSYVRLGAPSATALGAQLP